MSRSPAVNRVSGAKRTPGQRGCTSRMRHPPREGASASPPVGSRSAGSARRRRTSWRAGRAHRRAEADELAIQEDRRGCLASWPPSSTPCSRSTSGPSLSQEFSGFFPKLLVREVTPWVLRSALAAALALLEEIAELVAISY